VFDATYLKKGITAHAEAAGVEPTVDIHMVNGHAHRVRSVIEVTDGYVVLEIYQRRPEMTGMRSPWQSAATKATSPNETHRAVISYESITQIVITPAEDKSSSRIGFSAPH
jgi:hypothetical protein